MPPARLRWRLDLVFALAVFFVIVAAAQRFKMLPAIVRRFPIASLHGLLLSLLAACAYYTSHQVGTSVWGAGIATLVVLIPLVLWRSSYVMLAGRNGTIAASRFTDHLACWLPLWGGTTTPLGKGYDYLRQRVATDNVSLARCRASGLKLLLLALIWNLVDRRFVVAGGGTGLGLPSLLGGWSMPVPDLATAIAAGPDRHGLGVRWLSMTLEFLRSVIQLAASGHVVIGTLRLFGFNVFRNTYKPLLAPTIVEFWNRYYYYFKELLVEFFFYPAFLALAKRRPAVRIVLSVLAAATVGNLYYHMVRDYQWFVDGGVDAFIQWIGSRGIYCVVLGLGVAASMLRERRTRGQPARSAGALDADARDSGRVALLCPAACLERGATYLAHRAEG